MTLRQYRDIVALQNSAGEVFGFHLRNLEVARLNPNAWEAVQALHQAQTPPHSAHEAAQEILQWNASSNSEARDQTSANTVRYLSLNVTQICNLRCTYCGAAGDGTYGSTQAFLDVEKALPQIRKLMERLPAGETFTLRFLGGEPLLHPEAIRMIATYAQRLAETLRLQVRFSITTNGTLVTPAVAELLADIQAHVTVSIDGPEQLNDVARPTKGASGATSRVVAGIQELIKVRDRLGALNSNSVFGAHNLQVRTAYEFLRAFNFDSIGLNFAASAKDPEVNQEFIEQVCTLADNIFANGGEAELRKIPEFDLLFDNLDQQCRTLNHCGAGKTLLQMDSRGDLYACNWFMVNPDNRLNLDSGELDVQRLEAYQAPLIELNNCQTCWARYMCGGGCMFVNEVKTGAKHTKDTSFCQRKRSFVAKGVELFAKARDNESGEELT